MSTLTSVSGFPRIGQNRELKKIIEASAARWSVSVWNVQFT